MFCWIFLNYMSHHKNDLLQAAAVEANRIYRLFAKYNPGFEDYETVNIIGYSLGSIVAVDLLTTQSLISRRMCMKSGCLTLTRQTYF